MKFESLYNAYDTFVKISYGKRLKDWQTLDRNFRHIFYSNRCFQLCAKSLSSSKEILGRDASICGRDTK